MSSTSTTPYDVIFVGAGHNALVAAAYLTRAGRRVCLLERSDVPGGWVRSEELTLPGFVHDTYSALHPSFVFGPVFAELGPELAGHGLRYVQGSVATGSSLPDGRSAVISTDPAELAAELDRLGDGGAWARLMADLGPHLQSLLPLLGTDLTSDDAAPLLAALQDTTGAALPYQSLLTGSGHDLVTDRFSSEELQFAVLPWLLHLGLGPHDAGGALWTGLAMALLGAGNPAPVGGSGRLTDALVALVTGHGGELRTGVEVDAVLVEGGRATGVRTTAGERLASRAVVASSTPDRLYGHLLRDAAGVPDGVRDQARRYRYRRGCLQINLALSARPTFADTRLDGGGAINLGRGVDALVTSVRQAEDGLLPQHPSISWHEPTALDPDRAPGGQAVVRLQALDVPLRPTGDALEVINTDGTWAPDVVERFTDRVIAETGRHIKGLEELVLARHMLSPADLARLSPNAGPGDHAAGHNALSQGLAQRPIPAHRGGYATAVPDLYMIGAASWPGPGVNGASGRAVALRLLDRRSGPCAGQWCYHPVGTHVQA